MNIYFVIAFRVITIMLVLLIATMLIYGKRPIGQLPVFDFLTILVIGAITGADIAEPDVHHMHIIFAIVVLFLTQKLINTLYLKSALFRKVTTFHPIIVIQDGKLIYKNIKKVRFTIEEVLMLLRESDIFNIAEVKYGILESSGTLSVLRHSYAEYVRKEDLNIMTSDKKLHISIIIDGKLQKDNIAYLGITTDEVHHIIKNQGYEKPSQVFYASMDMDRRVNISSYADQHDSI